MVQSASSAIIFQCILGLFMFPYRTFIVRTWSFFCVRIYGVWVHRQRVSTTFLTQKNSQFLCVLLMGFEPWVFGSWVRRPTNWATPSPWSIIDPLWWRYVPGAVFIVVLDSSRVSSNCQQTMAESLRAEFPSCCSLCWVFWKFARWLPLFRFIPVLMTLTYFQCHSNFGKVKESCTLLVSHSTDFN